MCRVVCLVVQRLLDVCGSGVLSHPGAPHHGPLTFLYKELGVPWLSEVVEVTPGPGLEEVPIAVAGASVVRDWELCDSMHSWVSCVAQLQLQPSWASLLQDRIAARSSLLLCGRRGTLLAGLKKTAPELLRKLTVGLGDACAVTSSLCYGKCQGYVTVFPWAGCGRQEAGSDRAVQGCLGPTGSALRCAFTS